MIFAETPPKLKNANSFFNAYNYTIYLFIYFLNNKATREISLKPIHNSLSNPTDRQRERGIVPGSSGSPSAPAPSAYLPSQT